MNAHPKKIAPWRIAIVFGVMLLLVIGVPSLPRPHLVYWAIAFAVEAALCLALLPFKTRD